MQALTNIPAETLGVAGRSPDRLRTRVLHIQHSFLGEPGREDGVRRGQALSGTEDSLHDRSSRTRGGGSIG